MHVVRIVKHFMHAVRIVKHFMYTVRIVKHCMHAVRIVIFYVCYQIRKTFDVYCQNRISFDMRIRYVEAEYGYIWWTGHNDVTLCVCRQKMCFVTSCL